MNLLKATVFIVVIYVLYQRLADVDILESAKSVNFNYFYIVLAILLMPLNWLMELLKWKIIVQAIVNVKNSILLHSLLAGISTGMITPNRIGNFIGRMIYFPPKFRIVLSLGTIYSNAAQFLASILPAALLYLIIRKDSHFNYLDVYFTNVNFVWIYLIIAILVVLYFIFPLIPICKFFRRWRNTLILFQNAFKNKATILLILSQVRFLIYSFQFYLLLLGFGATGSSIMFYGILFMYFFITLTPSLLFGKLLIRENYALFFLAPLISNELIILLASLSVWLLNLAIPSLIGLVFLLKSKHDAR